MFDGFAEAPPVLVQSLLFIENRELLDPGTPKRNPAVEWDRLSKAVLEKALNLFGGHRAAAAARWPRRSKSTATRKKAAPVP
jgi:membrane peptidoglycan carboxypeptidase